MWLLALFVCAGVVVVCGVLYILRIKREEAELDAAIEAFEPIEDEEEDEEEDPERRELKKLTRQDVVQPNKTGIKKGHFVLELPQEREHYLDLKEKNVELPVIRTALCNRAIATIALGEKIESEREKVLRVAQSQIGTFSIIEEFQKAVIVLNNEVDDIKHDAEEINQGWGEKIFTQAANFLVAKREKMKKEIVVKLQAIAQEKRKLLEQERQIKEEKERKKMEINEKKARERKEKQEKEKAERIAIQLIEEEEREKQKTRKKK